MKTDSESIYCFFHPSISPGSVDPDVDLQVTPATNSLPINRLGLKEGESQIDVVWIGLPGLTLVRQEQKYSRINSGYYKFEIPSTGFRAQLEVDKLGFVINYDTL